MDLNYSVDAYECDSEFHALEEKYKKKRNSVYRICFEPSKIAKAAGVAIKSIDSWEWSSKHAQGEAKQKAVIGGEGLDGLSIFECLDEGRKCFLDTYLGSDFYTNAASVVGEGTATMTAGRGTVPVTKNLFLASFEIKLDDDLKAQLEGQEAALAAENDGARSDNSTKEEL